MQRDSNVLYTELRLLEEIGRGSFGVVHRAIWRGTSVAAKILPGGHMHGLSDAVSREIAVYGYIIIQNYTINLCFHIGVYTIPTCSHYWELLSKRRGS